LLAAGGLAVSVFDAVAQRALDPANAFALPMAGIDSAMLAKFNYGRGLFHHVWAPMPHANGTVSGLGPLYNADGCAACHFNDGRGQAPGHGAVGRPTLVLALSGPKGPDPAYGAQLQDRNVGSAVAEGQIIVGFTSRQIELSGGEAVVLRQPEYGVDKLGFGDFGAGVVLGPRVAPPLIGMGFLEAVSADTLAALADPDDRNGDGISGIVPPGRFGWAGAVPTLDGQIAIAAHKDMGLSSPGHASGAGDCTPVQTECQLLSGVDAQPDLSASDISLLADYLRFLAVPVRRNTDAPEVVLGERLFAEIGCVACHVPALTTAADAAAPFTSKSFSAYSDLLLHDMGPGLADTGENGNAEWRTAPLWGIGLTEVVSGHSQFLHDGRADGFTQAILWHGGEGETARDRFAGLDPEDRSALLAFLGSL
jgi:CxxC motif-containing protein (DUF1111 family)